MQESQLAQTLTVKLDRWAVRRTDGRTDGRAGGGRVGGWESG